MNQQQPNERYWELAEKWLNGTITPEEAKEYTDWYNTLSPDDVLEIPPHVARNKEEHRRKLLRKINEERGVRHSGKIIPFKWKHIAAAAVAAIAITGFFYLKRSSFTSQRQVAVVQPATDIRAGINSAVLTLGNGKTIVLDTAGNGSLQKNDLASITKSGSALHITDLSTGSTTAIEYNTLRTPRASQQKLMLADGTIIWLNAESSVRFPTVFAGNKREIEITGEAYLEVAKDKTKPFIVKVNDAHIEVLGTHFNVMAYANEQALETTLMEGAVKFIKGENKMLLKPGQQSRLLPNQQLTLVPDADLEQVMAWKNGIQSFNSADIQSIMRQVERWYDVEVTIQGNLSDRTFSGDIPRSATLSELLRLFQATRIHFSIDAEKRKLIVLP